MYLMDAIKKMYIVRKEEAEESKIEKILRLILKENDGILFCYLSTNQFFPRIEEIDIDGKFSNVLIWDKAFWDFYIDYMNIMYAYDKYIASGVEEAITFHNVMHTNIYEMRLYCIISRYLGIVCDKNLSHYFAMEYRRIISTYRLIDELPKKPKAEYLDIAKTFIAFHEYGHYICEHNPEVRNHNYGVVRSYLKTAKLICATFSESFCIEKYLSTKEQLNSTIDEALSNDIIIEELSCDLSGINQCLDLFINNWKDKYKKQEIITKCMECIEMISFMVSLLQCLKMVWCERYTVISEYEEHLHDINYLLTKRLYLLEFVSLKLLVDRGEERFVDYGKSVFKHISDRGVVESFIYGKFLDKSKVEEIKEKSKRLCVEASNESFELMGWKV